jgi:hypothetical protein
LPKSTPILINFFMDGLPLCGALSDHVLAL